MTQEPSVDSDDQADATWLLSIQHKLYQWSEANKRLALPVFLESRMHNERCTSGSARCHAKPAAARPPWRAWPTLPFVATRSGFAYVAFVIDVFARRIVGWKASSAPNTALVLDALEQAICDRMPGRDTALIHHSDRGVQDLAFRYSKRLSDAEIQPSVGRVGDSYAMAETVIGLFKTEVIRQRPPWRGVKDVEFATLEWADWFNYRRLLESIGYVPPAEAESTYYQQNIESGMTQTHEPPKKLGAVQ